MSAPNTLCEVFDLACQKYATLPAITCLNHTLNYAQLNQLANQFANYLRHHTSLATGDRIAVQLPNLLQYPVVVYGALKAGLVIVNTNPLYTAREIEHQMKDSGAKAMVVLANFAETAASVIRATPVEHVIVTEVADLHPPINRWLINGVVKYVKREVGSYAFDSLVDFRNALKLGAEHHFESNQHADEDDIAVLQYTGGTTGVAKAAILRHKNLLENSQQVLDGMADVLTDGEEIYACPLPLYHIYAFNFHCITLFRIGAHSILIPNPRDLKSLVKAIAPYRFTGFVGLDTLFKNLCLLDEFKRLDFSAVKMTASGGMALKPDTAALWKSVVGQEPCEGYGLSETSPVVTVSTPTHRKLGYSGRALPRTELKIIQSNGTPAAAGEPGELWVRGPQVMSGYWNQPEETAKVLTADGWFDTGDIASVDEDGYLRIEDRKKDMIIVSGFNVYPNEVEAVIMSHPLIVEAAVVGVPDDSSGEAVKVFYVALNDEISEAELKAHCKGQLTAYKRPKYFERRDELPKSNVGKILRKDLRSGETEVA